MANGNKQDGLLREMPRRRVAARRESDVTVLWRESDGIQCVIAPYDETRYQLRLLRQDGTVKADLFSDYAQALATSLDWRNELRNNDDSESDLPD